MEHKKFKKFKYIWICNCCHQPSDNTNIPHGGFRPPLTKEDEKNEGGDDEESKEEIIQEIELEEIENMVRL